MRSRAPKMSVWMLSMALLVVVAGGWFTEATASIITPVEPNPDRILPPLNCFVGNLLFDVFYGAQFHNFYQVTLPDGRTIIIGISRVKHLGFEDIIILRQGANEIEMFDSRLDGELIGLGGPSIPFTLTGSVAITTFGKAGQTSGTFDQEMTSMVMTGTIPGLGPVVLQEDPNRTSTGRTSISMPNMTLSGQPLPVGRREIESSFDVFTEISFNGIDFFDSLGSGHVVADCLIPEPSSLVLTGMGILGLAGYRWRRRLRAA